MVRRMDYTVEFDAPPEKIYQDFTSREYWQTLMGAYRAQGVPRSEVTSFRSDDHGTEIVFIHVVPREYLPPIARSVMPVDMVITRTQRFDPYDHDQNRARGDYTATVTAGPGHFGGRYVLTETDTGSTLRLASECRVWIPFVGGKLETLILDGMVDVFRSEEAFTADWIARHH